MSFEFFGLVHAGDVWSGQLQFQHLLFSSLTSWEKLHAFPLLQPWSVRKKRHFGFSSFPSSLFVGDLPVSSSPFFAFVL